MWRPHRLHLNSLALLFAKLDIISSFYVCWRSVVNLPRWSTSERQLTVPHLSSADGESPEPPATLRSRAALGSADPSQKKPLLARCGCRQNPVIVPPDLADSGASGSGSGSTATDECAVSLTPDSSAGSSSSSSDSGASQRHAPVGRKLQPAPAATRAAPLQVEADVIAVDTDAFDPPPKPGREVARAMAAAARPARPATSVNGARRQEQVIEMVGPSRQRAAADRPA